MYSVHLHGTGIYPEFIHRHNVQVQYTCSLYIVQVHFTCTDVLYMYIVQVHTGGVLGMLGGFRGENPYLGLFVGFCLP